MDEWVWSNGAMILTEENWSTGRKTLESVGGRWMNGYGAMVEWYWQRKTEVLREKHYTAWVIDGWKGMEQWWNDTDKGKLKSWEKQLSQCPSVRHRFTQTWLQSNPPFKGDGLITAWCWRRSVGGQTTVSHGEHLWIRSSVGESNYTKYGSQIKHFPLLEILVLDGNRMNV